jgi:hypothetical protein
MCRGGAGGAQKTWRRVCAFLNYTLPFFPTLPFFMCK